MDGHMSTDFGSQLPVVVTAQPNMISAGKKRRHFCLSHPIIVGILVVMAIVSICGVVSVAMLYQRVKHLEQNWGDVSVAAGPMGDSTDKMNLNDSSSHSHHTLWRRDAQEPTDAPIEPFLYHTGPSATGLMPTNSFVHVVGSKIHTYREGEWVSWMTESNDRISLQQMPFKNDHFIIVPKPGFYYVYTQLTYGDIRSDESFYPKIGHEIVRQANCGRGESQSLMTSQMTQARNISATDSIYNGGVFYLYTNDRVGVRMMINGAVTFKLRQNPYSLCSFGAYMVAPDPSYDSRIDDTCCCLGA